MNRPVGGAAQPTRQWARRFNSDPPALFNKGE